MDFVPFRDYARNLLGRIASSGWRPYFGWGLGTMCLLAVKFALLDAPRAGIALDGAYYTFVLGCLSLFVATFITRAVEKDRERRAGYVSPTGGLQNNQALA